MISDFGVVGDGGRVERAGGGKLEMVPRG